MSRSISVSDQLLLDLAGYVIVFALGTKVNQEDHAHVMKTLGKVAIVLAEHHYSSNIENRMEAIAKEWENAKQTENN